MASKPLSEAEKRRRAKKRKFLKLVGEDGWTVGDAARELGINKDTPSQWANRDKKFASLYAEAKAKHKRRKPQDLGPKSWKAKFLAKVEETKDRVAALEELELAGYEGVSALAVERACTPNSGRYDERFATALKEMELRQDWRIEDRFRIRAESRAQEARFVLSAKKKYRKSPSVVVDQRQQVIDQRKGVWYSGKQMESARDWVQGLRGTLGLETSDLSADQPKLIDVGAN